MILTRLHDDRILSIVEFDKLCFPTDHWTEADWKDLLQDERAIYYAILDGDDIVGDIFLYNWKNERDYIKIMNLAVHPDYRRQGLARRLLDHAATEMEQIGMTCFRGETRASNRAMQTVFERCGYVLDHAEEHYYDHPVENAYKYVLQL